MCPELARLWVDWAGIPQPPDDGDPHLQFMFKQDFSSLEFSLRAFATARGARGHPLSHIFLTYRRAWRVQAGDADVSSRDSDIYTICEYDGNFTSVLSPVHIISDGEDVSRPRLEELFAQLWDRVEDAEVDAGVVP